MANSVKAELSATVKRINLIKIAVVATISVVGLILAAVSIFRGAFLFALAYLVAGVLGVLYTIIEINSTLPPSIECDGERLILNTWENGFFPYKIDFTPRFFADFVPAKSVSSTLPLDDITELAIGTKGFLTRTLKSREIEERLTEICLLSRRIEGYMKRCDILCVRLKDDSIHMMSVKDFDMDAMYKIIDMTEHRIQGLEFKTNVRKLRRKRETIEGRQRI